ERCKDARVHPRRITLAGKALIGSRPGHVVHDVALPGLDAELQRLVLRGASDGVRDHLIHADTAAVRRGALTGVLDTGEHRPHALLVVVLAGVLPGLVLQTVDDAELRLVGFERGERR